MNSMTSENLELMISCRHDNPHQQVTAYLITWMDRVAEMRFSDIN